jgi:predicted nucleotidyltransferase
MNNKNQTIISQLKEKIPDIAKQHQEITAIFLYGSILTDRFTDKSDIDLGVLFLRKVESESYFDLILDFDSALSGLSAYKMNSVIMNGANLILLREIIQANYILFENDRHERIDFCVKRTIDYMDFKPYFTMMKKGLLSRIRQVN